MFVASKAYKQPIGSRTRQDSLALSSCLEESEAACIPTAAPKSFTQPFLYTRPLWMKSRELNLGNSAPVVQRCSSRAPHVMCCSGDKHRASESLEPGGGGSGGGLGVRKGFVQELLIAK